MFNTYCKERTMVPNISIFWLGHFNAVIFLAEYFCNGLNSIGLSV